MCGVGLEVKALAFTGLLPSGAFGCASSFFADLAGFAFCAAITAVGGVGLGIHTFVVASLLTAGAFQQTCTVFARQTRWASLATRATVGRVRFEVFTGSTAVGLIRRTQTSCGNSAFNTTR
jgi:hypothetical protein